MTIEAQYGVPTVAVHTDKFDRVVRSVASVNGMPGLQQVFVPQPVMGKSARELRAYVDGNDPLTGRPVMQEVVEALTRPFDDEDLKPVEFDRSEEHTSELQSQSNLVCRLLLEQKKLRYALRHRLCPDQPVDDTSADVNEFFTAGPTSVATLFVAWHTPDPISSHERSARPYVPA